MQIQVTIVSYPKAPEGLALEVDPNIRMLEEDLGLLSRPALGDCIARAFDYSEVHDKSLGGFDRSFVCFTKLNDRLLKFL